MIDYGHAESQDGDTLQAVGAHSYADPLKSPGSVDLTAHVDFQALGETAESMGARVHGPVGQGDFLRRLGIDSRAAALKKNITADKVVDIDMAMARLVEDDSSAMGRLFKAIGLANPKLGPLPGFDGCAKPGIISDAARPLAALTRYPARLLHPRRRRLGRALCHTQWRRRLAATHPPMCRKPRADGGRAWRGAGPSGHRLSNPFAACRRRRSSVAAGAKAARRRHRHARSRFGDRRIDRRLRAGAAGRCACACRRRRPCRLARSARRRDRSEHCGDGAHRRRSRPHCRRARTDDPAAEL